MPSTPPQTFATYPAASSSAVPVSTVTSPSQAAAVVFASNPLFSSILPESTDSNQPATSYTASEAATGYVVSVTIGQHTWNYSVGTDGKVTLVSQQGAAPQATPDAGTSDPATVVVALVAGPVCPVERNPPDPNCAARPVPNASVILRDATGQEVRSGTADATGTVTFTVPGGAYYVEPAPVGGLMRAPSPTAFSVPGGRDAKVTLTYDTGIR